MTDRRPRGRAPRPVRLVRPTRRDPSGESGPTRGQARGGKWRRTSHGFYVPVSVSGDLPEQRILEQSMRLPPGGAVTGWAAGRLRGAGYLDGVAADGRTRLPVPLAVGARSSIRSGSEVQLLRHALAPEDVSLVLGIPCVIAERAAFDAARSMDLTEALVVVDMLMLAECTSLRRLHDYAARMAGAKGSSAFDEVLDLADENSWSPNEVRTRKIWLRDAALPRPLVNQPIFDRRGRLLGFPDLLDEAAGLVCEFDGADHRSAGRHSSDVSREALFRRHALEVTRVTGPDVGVRGLVQGRLIEARGRALWLPEQDRPWTTTTPSWWDPGPTLDMRLEERDAFWECERGFGEGA